MKEILHYWRHMWVRFCTIYIHLCNILLSQNVDDSLLPFHLFPGTITWSSFQDNVCNSLTECFTGSFLPSLKWPAVCWVGGHYYTYIYLFVDDCYYLNCQLWMNVYVVYACIIINYYILVACSGLNFDEYLCSLLISGSWHVPWQYQEDRRRHTEYIEESERVDGN